MDWLAFSLSNQQCLLDAFNSSPHEHQHHHGMSAEGGEESISGAPKLEDFLGGSGEPLGRFSGESAAAPVESPGGIYDSELKNIAAGFLPEDKSKALVTGEVIPETKKTVDTFGQRTSIYRGVTRHRWTGRYEAHLWDNSCRREGQSRKGRQVYLGGYDKEEKAARAYDLAALKYWGSTTTTNFPLTNYEKELEEMKNMTRQEFVASLRRKSSGFSRGVSMYRGVTRHHQHGRWQARIGRVAGNKDLYLGTFGTEEEAAEAYDIAAIKFRGLNAVTNFDMSRYDVKSILASNLPIGGMSGRTIKASESSSSSSDVSKQMEVRDMEFAGGSPVNQHLLALPLRPDQHHQHHHDYWSLLALHHQQLQQQQQQHAHHGVQEINGFFDVYSSGVNMDFSSAALLLNNGHLAQQQPQGQNGGWSTAYASSAANENSDYGGGWVAAPPSSPMLAAKTSMGFFQTPIFGIE